MPGLPEIRFRETRRLSLAFGLRLYDAFTRDTALRGDLEVTAEARPHPPGATRQQPFVKRGRRAFLFFGLEPGDHTITIASGERTPYYLPAEIDVTLPLDDPKWPLFPERGKADTDLPAWSPAQPADFRAQLDQATLRPAVAYPFPDGATVVRGTVISGGTPLPGVTVARTPAGVDDIAYVTEEDGEFVLFYHDLDYFDVGSEPGDLVTLLATHPSHPDQTHEIRVRRGQTAVTEIDMSP